VKNIILQFIPLFSRISLPFRFLTGRDVLTSHLIDMRHIHHPLLPLVLEHLWQCVVGVYKNEPCIWNRGDVG
jgi:hypothetical protein